jgi:hypothetical protein
LDGFPVGICKPKSQFTILHKNVAPKSVNLLTEKNLESLDLVVLRVDSSTEKTELFSWLELCEKKNLTFAIYGDSKGKYDEILVHNRYISRGKLNFSNCAYLGPLQLFFNDEFDKDNKGWIETYPASGNFICIFGGNESWGKSTPACLHVKSLEAPELLCYNPISKHMERQTIH